MNTVNFDRVAVAPWQIGCGCGFSIEKSTVRIPAAAMSLVSDLHTFVNIAFRRRFKFWAVCVYVCGVKLVRRLLIVTSQKILLMLRLGF